MAKMPCRWGLLRATAVVMLLLAGVAVNAQKLSAYTSAEDAEAAARQLRLKVSGPAAQPPSARTSGLCNAPHSAAIRPTGDVD